MKRKIKAPLIYLAKKYPVFKAARHIYLKQRASITKRLYKNAKIDPKLVVFDTFNGRSYSDSPRAIYEAMLKDKRFDDYDFVWAFKKPEEHQALVANPRTSLVKYRSLNYFKIYATAKYWITNAMLPLELGKRDEQVLVQCWHGTPLKRLRNDIVEDTQNAMNSLQDFIRKNDADTVRYNYFVSPSRFASKAFTTAFDLKKLGKSNILLETGYPRNDFLFKFKPADVKRIRAELNLPAQKKVLLYAPTWRDDQHSAAQGYVYKNPVDFDYLKTQLADDWIILFRAHYLVANGFDFDKYQGFIYDVSHYEEVSQLYVVADALMTDYSSVFFDYANLGRPMLFYMYDLDHYRDDLRGFYFDLDELPGAIVKTEREVATELNQLEAYQRKYSSKYKAFNKKFNYLDDAKASERLINSVFGSQDDR